MNSGVVDSNTAFFQHVKKSGLAGIIEAQEKNFCVFVI
jgi:hypothetical protein